MCVYTYPFVFAYMVGRSVDEVGGWTGPKPLYDKYMYKYMRRRMDRALDLIHAANGLVYDKK